MVYQGSKARVAKYICPIIQKYIDEIGAETFIDAFCGGANVIQHISAYNKIGYDTNPYLIALLNNLDKIESVEVPISREHYNDVKESWRAKDGRYEDWYVGTIGFIASFGGKFFDGSYGRDDCYKDNPALSRHTQKKNNILRQVDSLKDCSFETKDFFTLDIKNAVIYCDPPYNKTTKYPYDIYETDKFWNKVRELSKDNIVLVSELSAPDDFKELWRKEIRNTVGSSNSLKQTEKLFIIGDKND